MQMPGLAQVAVRHLGSYVELMGQAACEYRSAFLRRALLAAGALFMGTAALAATWTTGLATLWDTPWRIAYCIASAVLCLATTMVLALLANRRSEPGPHIRTLREEATQDLALLQEWRRTA
jgi:membrane protein implicated in regulation of membrane protease activity